MDVIMIHIHCPRKELLVLIPFSQLILVYEIQNIFMQELDSL